MSLEIAFKIFMTFIEIVFLFFYLKGVWSGQVDVKQSVKKVINKITYEPDFIAKREKDKLYQNGEPVAKIVGEIQEKGVL